MDARHKTEQLQLPTGTSAKPVRPQHAYLMTEEAAQFLRLSPRTLERFRVEGTGPRYTKAGPGKRARVLYKHEDLVAWLESFECQSTAEHSNR